MTDDLVFPDHVRKQMARRNIPEQAVYDAVEGVDSELECDDGVIKYTKI